MLQSLFLLPFDPNYLTHPCIHAFYTVHTAPSSPPGGLTVTHSLPTTAQLSWTPLPAEDQNGVITGYTVTVEGPDSTQTLTVPDSGATSLEVPGLRPFTAYIFSVSAMTAAGTGPTTSVSSTTPQGG